jgi:two-component system cell cycle response regulator CtrA
MRVLVATTDLSAAAGIEVVLAKETWISDTLDIGEDDLWLDMVGDYDIILFDLMLPSAEGYRMLQRLRAARVPTPILILATGGAFDDKLRFLRSGADDFLTKPYDPRELAVRILAIVRRSKGHPASTIQTGKLAVNLDTRTVSVDDQTVHLSPKEYSVLELLSLRKGAVVTKERFLNYLYGGMDEPESKILDVLVCKLRKKLAQATGGVQYIETQWGQGYVLREPTTVPSAARPAEDGDLGARDNQADIKSPQRRADAGQAYRSRRQTAPPLGQIEQRAASRRHSVRDRPVGRDRSSGVGLGAEARHTRPVEIRFEDAVTTDGGPLHLPRPDPAYSLFGCATARCHE